MYGVVMPIAREPRVKNERCGKVMAASKLPEVPQLGKSPRPTSLPCHEQTAGNS
jgi:hypothetical protein